SLGAPFAPPTIPTSGVNGPPIGPAGDQLGSANATSRSGDYQVIVWTDNAAGNDRNIMGQVHYQKTAGLFTPSYYVNFAIDTSTYDDSQPSVAINDNGNFVVTWTRTFSDGSLGVMVREYDNLDQPLGNAFVVNHTAGHAQYDSHVAISPITPASGVDEF